MESTVQTEITLILRTIFLLVFRIGVASGGHKRLTIMSEDGYEELHHGAPFIAHMTAGALAGMVASILAI